MSRKGISVIVAVVIIAIIAVIIIDFQSKRPDKLGANPYGLDVSEYEKVDSKLIHYRETKNIPFTISRPGGIELYNDLIYLTGENVLQVFNSKGTQKMKIDINGIGTCLKVTDDAIFIGYSDHIDHFTHSGELVSSWDVPGDKCVFTCIDVMDSVLYVADAGNRRVLRYDLSGNMLGEFEGKAESSAGHGFIVPSANFDLVTNSFGELWVVNPGKHAIENYTGEGILRGFWENSSMAIEGFTGCCNPAEIAVLEDGSFITSEKGLVRIKVYDQSGKLLSVVAAPEKFEEDGRAPEVKSDSDGNIYALDFDRRMIRIFEKR